jgi:hypothetical protein
VTVRDVIVCLPTDAASLSAAIRAVCGVCQADVWLTAQAKEQYFGDPERFVLACLDCTKFLYHTQGQARAEIHMLGDEPGQAAGKARWLQNYLNAESN